MPETTIPLVGVHNQRPEEIVAAGAANGKDQIFKNVMFDVIQNPATQSKTIYVVKRPGLLLGSGSGTPVASGTKATAVYKAPGGVNEYVVSAWGANNSTIIYAAGATFKSGTDCGTITGEARSITDISISGVLFFLIASSDGTGWFLSESAATDATPTFTGDTHTNTTLDNVSSTANLYIGQKLSGTGIQSGTRISNIVGTTITLSLAATATNSGVTITFERVAKIIDADFPTNIVGGFAQLDGYALIMTADGKIYNSDLNSVTSWGASNYISANMSTDNGVGVARFKNQIVAFGTQGTEFFYNAGNPSGSPLSRTEQAYSGIGCQKTSGNNMTYYQFNDSIYFISNFSGDGAGVYVLDGFAPRKISSQVVDSYLSSSIPSSSVRIAVGTHRGQTVVILSGNTSYTLVIFPEIGIDAEWAFNGSASYDYVFCSGGGSTAASRFIYAVNSNPGSQPADTLRLTSDYFSDYLPGGTVPFTLSIQTSKVDLGTGNRKSYKTVWLIGSDIQSSGTATLEFSDDDYATWTTAGTFDLTQSQPKIDRCGSHKGGRAWRLTHSADTAFRAQALKFDYTIGRH